MFLLETFTHTVGKLRRYRCVSVVDLLINVPPIVCVYFCAGLCFAMHFCMTFLVVQSS